MWCDSFIATASTAVPAEIRDKRWLSCLHGAFYYMDQAILGETKCDEDILAVSESVASGCKQLRGNPWGEDAFELLSTLDTM